MSSYELSEILDIAQRELLCSTPFFSVAHHWQRYCEAFSHSERISFTPASLNSLRLRARQKRYQNDIRHARQYFTKRFPPLSLHESLLAYIRRAMSNQTNESMEETEDAAAATTSAAADEKVEKKDDADVAMDDTPTAALLPQFIDIENHKFETSQLRIPEPLSTRYKSAVVISTRRYNVLLKDSKEAASARRALKRSHSESPSPKTTKKKKRSESEGKPRPKLGRNPKKVKRRVGVRQQQRRKNKVKQLARVWSAAEGFELKPGLEPG